MDVALYGTSVQNVVVLGRDAVLHVAGLQGIVSAQRAAQLRQQCVGQPVEGFS